MRRHLLPLLLLNAIPAAGLDLCPWPVTVRGSVPCPVGVPSSVCVSSAGSPLTYLQADRNFADVVGLCSVEERIVVTSAPCEAGDVPLFDGDTWECTAAPPGPTGPTGPTGPAGPAGPSPSGTANQVLATPNGSSGTAALRALVAADLPAGTGTIVGSLGLTARFFPRAAGTDGVTLEPSPNFFQDSAGNLVLGDLSGARQFWLSTVETAPVLGRNGIALWVRSNTGGYAPLHVGWAEFQDPSNPVTFAGGQKIANGKSIEFSDGIDYNRGLGRFADGMLGPRDGAGSPMGWKDKGEVNAPQASPPWACDSAHDGGTYRDSTGPGTRCECFFASGDGWINMLPSRSGSDCS